MQGKGQYGHRELLTWLNLVKMTVIMHKKGLTLDGRKLPVQDDHLKEQKAKLQHVIDLSSSSPNNENNFTALDQYEDTGQEKNVQRTSRCKPLPVSNWACCPDGKVVAQQHKVHRSRTSKPNPISNQHGHQAWNCNKTWSREHNVVSSERNNQSRAHSPPTNPSPPRHRRRIDTVGGISVKQEMRDSQIISHFKVRDECIEFPPDAFRTLIYTNNIRFSAEFKWKYFIDTPNQMLALVCSSLTIPWMNMKESYHDAINNERFDSVQPRYSLDKLNDDC